MEERADDVAGDAHGRLGVGEDKVGRQAAQVGELEFQRAAAELGDAGRGEAVDAAGAGRERRDAADDLARAGGEVAGEGFARDDIIVEREERLGPRDREERRLGHSRVLDRSGVVRVIAGGGGVDVKEREGQAEPASGIARHGAGEDKVVARPRGGDEERSARLGLVTVIVDALHKLRQRGLFHVREGEHDAEAAVDVKRRVAGVAAAAEVGDDDDGKLEPFGGVNCHDADDVVLFGLDDGLAFARFGLLEVAEARDELLERAPSLRVERVGGGEERLHIGDALGAREEH